MYIFYYYRNEQILFINIFRNIFSFLILVDLSFFSLIYAKKYKNRIEIKNMNSFLFWNKVTREFKNTQNLT